MTGVKLEKTRAKQRAKEFIHDYEHYTSIINSIQPLQSFSNAQSQNTSRPILNKKKSNNSFQGLGAGVVDENDQSGESADDEATTIERIQFYLIDVSKHLYFQILIMAMVLTSSILAGMDFRNTPYETQIQIVELGFLGAYTFEFLIKVLGDWRDYFNNNYTRFDFLILIVSYVQIFLTSSGSGSNLGFLRVFRALRSLRALRMIGFFRTLQVIVNALLKTLRTNVKDLIFLLLLLMFIFAVMAINFFGQPGGDEYNWGSFGGAFAVLMTHVTADSWTDYQDILVQKGFEGCQWFSIIFLYIGHFLFTNIFIAIIIQNIHEATELELEIQEKAREESAFLDQQPLNGIEKQFSPKKLEDLLAQLKNTVRHDDIFPTDYLSCDLTWLETYRTFFVL
ncbi:hypothetical protein ROZALSC1DRAFT_27047 [Rozella allomycis CSF55]|uniref:Ion transport domain-containing protein n=1 Tax=Rozella allomycis (strain CSF55) TaxID=988480 RepID=A0A075B130_ROZAC|nr:Ion transport domain-containing protein [Rozella allomycis CSF55]RKP21561.1 hypothetical protein ROZALSC1DRAFT_27047 [Rozella allomycis CSF55]|eukprot:EPZ34646.1 Ion transport domain-containing protein [Rozella allomycis CSF55]